MRYPRLMIGLALVTALTASIAAFGTAKGTLLYKGKTRETNVTLKFAYLVKGPDAIDPKMTIRRLILTSADIEKKLAACTTMMCTSDESVESLSIDLDAGPRLNYWLALNGGLVQYSGTTPPASMTKSAETPTRLAGKIVFDGTGAGGPKVDAEFDATLLKTLTKAR